MALPQTDTFTRTVASGWGTSDSGTAWGAVSGGSASVDGSHGVVTPTAVGTAAALSYALGVQDADWLIVIQKDKTAATSGSTQQFDLQLRRNAAGNTWYRVRVQFLTGGSVTVQHAVSNAGTVTNLDASGVTVSGVTDQAATDYNVRIRVSGSSPTTVQTKVWPVGSTEPSTWVSTRTDSTAALQGATGDANLRWNQATGAGATTSTLKVDSSNWTVPGTGGGAASGVPQSDTFTRTVASGWGTSDSGNAWTGGDSVSGGFGLLAVATAGTANQAKYPLAYDNAQALWLFQRDKTAATNGATQQIDFSSRVNAAGTSRYRCRVQVTAAGVWTIELGVYNGGAFTSLQTVTVSSLADTAGANYLLRFDTNGTSNPVVLSAKLWLASASEPAAWQAQVNDATVILPAGDQQVNFNVTTGAAGLPTTLKIDQIDWTAASTAPSSTTPVVPADGQCMVGAWIKVRRANGGSGSTVLSQTAAMDQVTQQWGRKPAIWHWYSRNAGNLILFTSHAMTTLTADLVKADGWGSYLFPNWKTTSWDWSQIPATGHTGAPAGVNSDIDLLCSECIAYGKPMFVGITGEPEAYFGKTAGATAANFQNMFRYVVKRARANGVVNVSWVWNTTGMDRFKLSYDASGNPLKELTSPNPSSFYPLDNDGSDTIVDWIGPDPYNWRGVKGSTVWTDAAYGQRSLADMLTWICDWVDWKHPTKPMMFPEWSCAEDPTTDGSGNLTAAAKVHKHDWFMKWSAAIATNAKTKRLKAICIFDSNPNESPQPNWWAASYPGENHHQTLVSDAANNFRWGDSGANSSLDGWKAMITTTSPTDMTVMPSDLSGGGGGGGGSQTITLQLSDAIFGGVSLPTGGGLTVRAAGDSPDTQPLHDQAIAAGVALGMMSAEVDWSYVQPDRQTLRMSGTGGTGTGLDNSILDARARGYRILLRVRCGASTPAWAYSDPTNPVYALQLENSQTGQNITIPLAWDVAGAADARAASGTNLRVLYTGLVQKLAAWLNQTVTGRDGVAFPRSSVFCGVEITMPMVEDPWMSVAYGSGSVATFNRAQWQSVTNDTAHTQAQNQADLLQAWLDAIDIQDANLALAAGVPSVISYATLWADAWANALAIAQSLASGGANSDLTGRLIGWLRLLQPGNDGQGNVLYHDATAGTCATDPAPTDTSISSTNWSLPCWNANADAVLQAHMAAGAQLGFTTAGDSVFVAFTVDVAGSDQSTIAGPTHAWQVATQDAISNYGARFIEYSSQAQLFGDATKRLDAETDYAASVELQLDSTALGDNYQTSNPLYGDTPLLTVRTGGVRRLALALTDSMLGGQADTVDVRTISSFLPAVDVRGRHQWRIILTDRAGNQIATLKDATARQIALGINQPAACTLKLPFTSNGAAAAYKRRLGTTKLKAYRDGELWFNGRIAKRNPTYDDQGPWIQLVAYDGLAELRLPVNTQRAIFLPDDILIAGNSGQVQILLEGGPTGAPDYGQPGVNQRQFGYTGVERGRGIGSQRSSFALNLAAAGTVLDALQQMATGPAAIEYQCRPAETLGRWQRVAGWPDQWVEILGFLDLYLEGMGTDRDDVIFGIGAGPRNVQVADEEQTLDSVCNWAHAVGSGVDSEVVDLQSMSQIGRLYKSGQYTDVRRQARITDLAADLIQTKALSAASFTALPNAPRLWDHFDLGDTVRNVVGYDPAGLPTVRAIRVWNATVAIDDDGNEQLGQIVLSGEEAATV